MDNPRPIKNSDDLLEVFSHAEKPESAWKIGAESEKFGVDRATGRPILYARSEGGSASIEALFDLFCSRYGYRPSSEQPGGPLVALGRGAVSITLEPGAQLELSGAPWSTLHEVSAEIKAHFAELLPLSEELGIDWLGVGFHPTAKREALPWVPKQRYPIMREYLPKSGPRALDMMQRCATVQANFDFSSEEDALRKLCAMLRLAPLIQAMTANSPFYEGRVSACKSERGDVWLHMPPDRSGLIPSLWRREKLGYRDYVEWALDAGMFLFKRGDRVFANTGQTFRSFLKDGFEGERATVADWVLHLNTLFPEVRLKSTLEVRSCDVLPPSLLNTVPALYTGLLYDERALAQAEELGASFELDEVTAARPGLVTHGLGGKIGARSVRELAERILEIAEGGLERRARLDGAGVDETQYLAPLAALTKRGLTPADLLREGLEAGQVVPKAELLRRTLGNG